MEIPTTLQPEETYRHLTQVDRDRIQSLLDKEVKPAEIARIIGRDKTTIGREIARNKRKRGDIGVANRQQYQATGAHHKAYVRRLYASYAGKKIQEDDALQSYIIANLKKHWNPDEISGAMKETKQPFYASKTAIYEWLYSVWGQRYCHHLYTERSHARARKPKAKRVMIPDRVSITQRPASANDRSDYGHHEGDTIVSGKKTGSTAALAVDLERKSRFLSARVLANLKPRSFNAALLSIQSKLTDVKSRTYDNGIENRQHARLGVDSYFCDPYSSSQKGGIENGNKMIRRYFPKGMDLGLISPQRLASVIRIINNKPRKILGYKSAVQIMKDEGLLRQSGTTTNKTKVALGG